MALEFNLAKNLCEKVFKRNCELFLVQIPEVDEINRANFIDFPRCRLPPLIVRQQWFMGILEFSWNDGKNLELKKITKISQLLSVDNNIPLIFQ